MVAAWNAVLQYVQPVVLPAGTYTLIAPVYNTGGSSSVAKNLFGFVAYSGSSYLASNTTFAVGEWSDVSVTFTLEEETPGYLSVGYTAANTTSSNMPKLYVDYVHLSDGTHQWPTFLIGDVNKDGSVTIADVTALVNIILDESSSDPSNEGEYDLDAADLNQDGSVSYADVWALIMIILGK